MIFVMWKTQTESQNPFIKMVLSAQQRMSYNLAKDCMSISKEGCTLNQMVIWTSFYEYESAKRLIEI